ncbi:MAG: tetratricopeptide repeat protein [Calditrichia bacterium]|nr:tetratricopeptide repeat protein [Calditrichota bacterium]MCB0269536.1 tetratricopeptide repeat protein [Calditrichota bacterium]MCB9069731.1 tetratricopeptide repeat protein [Calditrichia bacterium]
MKGARIFGIVVFGWLLLFACSKQKLSETDYFGKANEYMEQQNWTEAEASFLSLLKEYPDGMFTARSLFMVGYLNANHLKDLEKAKTYYNDFIQKFPENELVTAAKYELEHLGKNPDELPFLNDSESSGTAAETNSSQAQKTSN